MGWPHRGLRSLFRITLIVLCAGFFVEPALAQKKDTGDFSEFLGKNAKLPELDKTSLLAKPSGPAVQILLLPANAKPGDTVTLSISVDVPEKGHTYSTSPDFGGGTRIDITEAHGLEAVDNDFVPNHAPVKMHEPLFGQDVEKHYEDVTWSRKYRILRNADPATVEITGKLNYQVCDDRGCTPYRVPIRVALTEGSLGSLPSKRVEPVSAVSLNPMTFESRPDIVGAGSPVATKASLSPEIAKPGDTVTLAVTLDIAKGWHAYSTTQDPKEVATPTTLEATALNGLKPVNGVWTPDRPPVMELTEIDKKTYRHEIYTGTVTWTSRFIVLPSAEQNGYGVTGKVSYQVCREQTCLRPQKISFSLGNIDAAAAGIAQASQGLATEVSSQSNEALRREGLVPFLIAAVSAGFLALLTPCVFPMVPITVSYFLKQAESEHHRPITMAIMYCVGIVVSFTVLGLAIAISFRATALNEFANNPWLNLVIAGVLVFFGFNLLGLFEIRMPGWLLTWSSQKQGKGGMIGTLFMALTFTLVSFTCTFAFVGGLLVWAANGEYYWPVIGMLAFSSAFAAPFFFLALFPSYLHSLPKSGGWMNRVKVTMGMIECGAAFKFLSVADLSWNPVPMLFDYALVMSAWMVLSICAGLYLIGVFRTSHDTPSESVGALRLASAMTFFGLAAYLAVGLFGSRPPTGKVWEQIAAFAPPRFESGQSEIGPTIDLEGMEFGLDYDLAVKYAKQKNSLLFLDFTGVNCVNCRKMESRMQSPQNRARLEKFVRVQLYTDNVPGITDEKLVETLLSKNRDLQENWFRDATLPAYAVVTPDGATVLASFKGVEVREGEFAEFLDTGTKNWGKIQTAKGNSPLAQR